MVDWNERFMKLAEYIASWSKDRSTKYAAIIIDKNHRIISTGYNGFPSGCNDEIEEWHQRPQKYFYSEHSERNAIYSAARAGIPLDGCTIVVNGFPCADCARAIIQSGIKNLVCYKPEVDDLWNKRWGESQEASYKMFCQVDIKLVYLEKVNMLEF